MPMLPTDMPMPLTLDEQLDAMLSGWLDRHDPDGARGRENRSASAVLTVAAAAVREIEVFCERRKLKVRQTRLSTERWAVLVVTGSALPVRGLAEITGMYRR